MKVTQDMRQCSLSLLPGVVGEYEQSRHVGRTERPISRDAQRRVSSIEKWEPGSGPTCSYDDHRGQTPTTQGHGHTGSDFSYPAGLEYRSLIHAILCEWKWSLLIS